MERNISNGVLDDLRIVILLPFPQLFSSYRDDGRMMMKGCVFMVEKSPPSVVLEHRSAGQLFIH